jgi:hypothetical protein
VRVRVCSELMLFIRQFIGFDANILTHQLFIVIMFNDKIFVRYLRIKLV